MAFDSTKMTTSHLWTRNGVCINISLICRYGICLIGVCPDNTKKNILLNPGPEHIMNPLDVCFYISLTKEENTCFKSQTGCRNSPKTQPPTCSAIASMGQTN